MDNGKKRDRAAMQGENTVPALFAAALAANEHRAALADESASCTYSRLDRWSNGIARAATRLTDGPGDRVCILTERSYCSTAAFLGLCKSGLVSLRIDTGHPDGYLRSIIDDADVRLIVTTRDHRDLARSLQTGGIRILFVEDCEDADQSPPVSPGPDDRACIAYTSGSTGRPKGVVHTHRSITAFAANYVARTELCREDNVAVLHEIRGLDTLSAIVTGASTHFFPLRRRGFSGLADWLIDRRITLLPTMPSVLRAMLPGLSGQRDALRVRLLRLSGEMLAKKDISEAAAVFPSYCRVLNWFGSTEVAIASCTLSLDDLDPSSTVAAGRVFSGLDVAIDDNMRTSRASVLSGEITVSSEALFEGYWKQPSLNAKKILPDPDRPDQRIFRTGDLGYFDAAGNLVVLGRADGQLKIDGYRIEPLEVEVVLRGVADIEDVVVVPIRTRGGRAALGAYVVTARAGIPEVGRIRQELAEKLPAHMIPGYFTRIDAVPRLASGKPNRRSLPELVPVTRQDYNPNRSIGTPLSNR